MAARKEEPQRRRARNLASKRNERGNRFCRRGAARRGRPCEKLLIAFRARAERPISSGLGVENRNEGTRNRGVDREGRWKRKTRGRRRERGRQGERRERVHNLCVFAERRIVSRRAIRGISWRARARAAWKTNVKSLGKKRGPTEANRQR